MLKELFDRVIEVADRANKPKVVHPKAEPKHVYWFGGKICTAQPSPRDHKALSLDCIVEFANRESARDKARPVVIWYSREAVVCITDDEERRDRVTMALAPSPQMLALKGLESKALSQRELILTLRTTFADCLEMAPNLIAIMRQVKSRTATSGEGKIAHGKVSIGKSLEAELTGADDIPEYVDFVVPIFTQGSLQRFRQKVRCALEPDPQQESFRLIPLAGAIESAISAAEEAIGAKLGEADEPVQVFYGSPK